MTAVSTQPNFYDFYSLIFKKYVTRRCSVNIHATNLGGVSVVISLIPLGDTPMGTFTTIQAVRELPRATTRTVSQAGSINSATIIKDCTQSTFNEMFERTSQNAPVSYLANARTAVTSAANYPIDLGLYIGPPAGYSGADFTVELVIKLVYLVEFTDREFSLPS